ncbi:LPS assembly protein LptD [Psychrobacter sp. NZS113]|uniref:LPS assembly protein LptD n=1 Tax=Psychrobacter sp. NZS113 TaxID=2792045 RepID=UPI002A0A4311|nr:LPS assembly protein LptD [Psychrobacter sp. NZS113]
MPLLYSPLYQSIRVILFGALGLSSLAVNAAISDADTQKTAPILTDSSTRYISKAAPNANSNVNQTHDYSDINYQASQSPKATTATKQSQQAAVATKSTIDDSTLTNSIDGDDTDLDGSTLDNSSFDDSKFSDDSIGNNSSLEITAIKDSGNKDSDTQDSNNPAFVPALDAQKNISATQTNNTSTPKTAKNTNKLDLSDESIQDSLMRLAEFYELTPDTEVPAADSTVDTTSPQTIPKVGKDLQLPIRTVDSSERCEGQWVYPKSNPNYQRAVNEAGATNSLENNRAPLFTESDYGYYDSVDYAELSGNVIINQGTQQIAAEKVSLDLSSGVAAAQGNVMFTDQATGQSVTRDGAPDNTSNSLVDKTAQSGLIGVADSLAYNTNTGQSTANDVAFASVGLQAHGYAKRLNRPNDSQYELDEVMFSTCPPMDRKWQFDAKSIDLDTETGRGKAYDTTFRIADVPVFYLPYFNFPIDSRRSSGVLLPNVGFDSESGLEIEVPYYLNLAPNYDATLDTHIYTDRNPMISGEFRYLTEDYGKGTLNGSYLPSDNEYDDEDRSSLFYEHTWESKSIPRLSGDLKYSYVSDSDYLDDFDTMGLSDSTVNLPRRARLNYYNDYVTGELKVESFQTLDAVDSDGEELEDKDRPYSRLPQLTLNYRIPTNSNFEVTGVSDSAYFKKSIDDGSENEKSGTRLYNKISAAYPIESSWGYIKPKLSLQHLYTVYDEDSLEDNSLSEEDGSQSVFVPQASIDAGLTFYQAGSPFGAFDDTMGGYQLLSPRLKYTYAPYEDQNDIPNFNTRIASVNYEQLFSDSWFLGHDRLQDLHAITPGVNYRYIDATGVTRFDGSIAEQFYIDDGRVTLVDDEPVFTTSSSGIAWDSSIQPYNNVWVDVNGALKHSYDLSYITTQLRYQPNENSLFNVGLIKRQTDTNTNQEELDAVTASAVFPINNKWRVMTQLQYDYSDSKMLDALVGVDYEDCCFGFAVYGRRYYNDLDITEEPTQAIMAEIRLSGLGSGKSSLTSLLSEKVLGFEPVQTAWKN